MRTSHLLYPFPAAFCYGMNLILAKLGLQASKRAFAWGVHRYYCRRGNLCGLFFASGQAGQLSSLPRQAGMYFGLAGLASTLAIFALFLRWNIYPPPLLLPSPQPCRSSRLS